MAIRITGMNSGLDTESIISELVKAKSAKKDKLVKAQTKLQWKQDAWKELNTKVYSLYSKTLSNMRLQSDYLKKTTKVSNASAATVITGANAVNGVQTLKIDKLAKSGYLTGGQLKTDESGNKITSSTKLTDIAGIKDDGTDKITLTINGEPKEIALTGEMTVDGLVKELKNAGLNASFDEKNQRFFISAKETGAAGDFGIIGDAAETLGIFALTGKEKTDYEQYCTYDKATGQYVVKDDYKDRNGQILADKADEVDNALVMLNKNLKSTKIDGQDAEITLNGAKFTSSSNTFEINGLTITANADLVALHGEFLYTPLSTRT